MVDLLRLLQIPFKFFSLSIKSIFSSKVDYYLGTFSLLLMQLASVVLIYIAFLHKDTLGGYSRAEILFYFSLSFTIQALIHLFTEGLWLVGPKYVMKGNLDYLLIRPYSALSQILMAHLHSSGIINLGFGLFFLILSLHALALPVSTYSMLLLCSFIICGFVINFSIILVISSLSFYFQKVSVLLRLYMTLQRFLAYPLDIFPQLIVPVFTFVIPLSFITYFPAFHFFESIRSASSGFSLFLVELIVLSVICLGTSLLVWQKGLQNYQGSHG